jgi:hypothetical protein
MGYRNYLGSLPKKEYNKIKSMTIQELYSHKGKVWTEDYEEDYIGPYNIVEKTEYELGKYVDRFPKEFFKSVFKKKETQKSFTEEHDFYLVEKEFVEHLINYYSEKVGSIYKNLLDPLFDEEGKPNAEFMTDKSKPLSEKDLTSVYLILDHVKSMGMEWGVKFPWLETKPYSLDPERELVSSWKYEYSIFNLVNLYRTFDWKKNIMIYYGY